VIAGHEGTVGAFFRHVTGPTKTRRLKLLNASVSVFVRAVTVAGGNHERRAALENAGLDAGDGDTLKP